jgi:hypothetical protein
MNKMLETITKSIEDNIRISLKNKKSFLSKAELDEVVNDELEKMGYYLVGLYRNHEDSDLPPPPPKSLIK